MLKTFILSLTTLSTLAVYGQTAKPPGEPGFAVTTKGDTLRGEINYLKKSGYRQSMQIKFPDQTTKVCSARNFTYVKAGDQVFESFLVPEAEERQFFWKKTAGKISFYEYQYEFYQLNSTVTKSEFYIAGKGAEELVRLNATNFRKKLEDLVKDDPKVAERINAKDTRLEDLEEILKEYNKGS